MSLIPEPPEKRVIESDDLLKLEKWIEHFRNLSPRIFIETPKDPGFSSTIEQSRRLANKHLPDSTIYTITDWPDIDDIAFIVAIDSSKPGHGTRVALAEDAYIFCFNDHAFGITYHNSESGPEEGDHSYDYSLHFYSAEALSWRYITERITERVEEYSNVVPDNV